MVHPQCIVLWKLLCPYVCVPVTLLVVPHVVWNVYMHHYMHVCPPDCPCLVHPLCIVSWKLCVPLCVTVCVFQSPCLWSHTLVRICTCILHVFMSTLLPMLAEPPMDSYMETLVPLCFTVCVSQSPCLWSHTLFRMCTCIST